MSVHYEFLDNTVPLGERPRTAAFGQNGELTVLDVKCMLDVDRYRKLNIEAAVPREVYPDSQAMAAANNTQFLTRCALELPALNFADRETGRIYARIESGRLAWTEPEALADAVNDAETRAGLLAVAPEAPSGARHLPGSKRLTDVVPADRLRTLGQWGPGTWKTSPS